MHQGGDLNNELAINITNNKNPSPERTAAIMSLPGLGLAAPTVSECIVLRHRIQYANYLQQKAAAAPIPVSKTAVHQVPPNSEWRFEVAIGSELTVRVSGI